MLAYAMAGIHAVVGSIRPSEGFSFEDDLNNFFLYPLQTAMDYYNRAEAISKLWLEHIRLQWLKAQDEADRTMWVHEFQHSIRVLRSDIFAAVGLRQEPIQGPCSIAYKLTPDILSIADSSTWVNAILEVLETSNRRGALCALFVADELQSSIQGRFCRLKALVAITGRART